ncbi:MAG: proton-translocating transhydrogenase family protein [Bacteroidota bacterium]
MIGAIILLRTAETTDFITLILGTIGIVMGMINVVGGFAVTNRMLEMFKKRKSDK